MNDAAAADNELHSKSSMYIYDNDEGTLKSEHDLEDQLHTERIYSRSSDRMKEAGAPADYQGHHPFDLQMHASYSNQRSENESRDGHSFTHSQHQ